MCQTHRKIEGEVVKNPTPPLVAKVDPLVTEVDPTDADFVTVRIPRALVEVVNAAVAGASSATKDRVKLVVDVGPTEQAAPEQAVAPKKGRR